MSDHFFKIYVWSIRTLFKSSFFFTSLLVFVKLLFPTYHRSEDIAEKESLVRAALADHRILKSNLRVGKDI